jgi:hypothetical protein
MRSYSLCSVFDSGNVKPRRYWDSGFTTLLSVQSMILTVFPSWEGKEKYGAACLSSGLFDVMPTAAGGIVVAAAL